MADTTLILEDGNRRTPEKLRQGIYHLTTEYMQEREHNVDDTFSVPAGRRS